MKGGRQQSESPSIVQQIGQALNNLNQSKGAHDFTKWFAHGATESANLIVHGHAAPMYDSGSPMHAKIQPLHSEQEGGQSPHLDPSENMELDSANVVHSEPLSPSHAPGHAMARLQRSLEAKGDRMNVPAQQQSQEMSR